MFLFFATMVHIFNPKEFVFKENLLYFEMNMENKMLVLIYCELKG